MTPLTFGTDFGSLKLLAAVFSLGFDLVPSLIVYDNLKMTYG